MIPGLRVLSFDDLGNLRVLGGVARARDFRSLLPSPKAVVTHLSNADTASAPVAVGGKRGMFSSHFVSGSVQSPRSRASVIHAGMSPQTTATPRGSIVEISEVLRRLG